MILHEERIDSAVITFTYCFLFPIYARLIDDCPRGAEGGIWRSSSVSTHISKAFRMDIVHLLVMESP